MEKINEPFYLWGADDVRKFLTTDPSVTFQCVCGTWLIYVDGRRVSESQEKQPEYSWPSQRYEDMEPACKVSVIGEIVMSTRWHRLLQLAWIASTGRLP